MPAWQVIVLPAYASGLPVMVGGSVFTGTPASVRSDTLDASPEKPPSLATTWQRTREPSSACWTV